MNLEAKALVSFLQKFDEHPFTMKIGDEEAQIGDMEIEGDLYHALNMFMGQMGKFSTDQKSLKKLIFSSLSKSNQSKEVSSHYDIGNDFCKLWLGLPSY